MEKLPPEIVTKILSLLDQVSLVSCRQVCRQWWILSANLCHPLYIPRIMSKVLRSLPYYGLRNVKNCRLVCKSWRNAVDKVTVSGQLPGLRGLTNISLHDPSELPQRLWNPFPTRIVRIKLCHGHDNPENVMGSFENSRENQFLSWFGEHISYLQVSLQHSKCAQMHLAEVLKKAKNIQGLIVSESPSPFRFFKTKEEEEVLEEVHDCEFIKLDNLKFLKFDDSDTTLKYTEFYKLLIQKSPNLEHLELNSYYHLDMGIVRLLSDRQPTKLCLTYLKMDAEDPNTQETLEILKRSSFHLIYFSIRINGFGDALECATCTNLLHDVLQDFGPTLKRLELKLAWFEKDETVEYPLLTTFPSSKSLTKLKRLKLVGFRGPLDFIYDFCNLEALMILDRRIDYDLLSSFHDSISTLTEIVLPESYNQGADCASKETLINFMYFGDLSFIPKYCGLCLEGFP